MPLLGAHTSIAGGLERALVRGREIGCEVVQIFTGSSRQWRSPRLGPPEIDAFRKAQKRTAVLPVAVHTQYLINLASPRADVFSRSLGALEDELERTELLGIPYVVLHPGAHLGSGERTGLKRVSHALDRVLERSRNRSPKVLLELTAGQGTGLGYRVEHLAEIIGGSAHGGRLGVCLDTCHAYEAGYDVRKAAGYARFVEAIEREVGLERVRLIHLNDSKTPLGSRVDRHEHIAEGRIGWDGLLRFLQDPRFARHPFILETPKGKDENGRDWDERNLARLRSASTTKGPV
jgi:deoxyribonuclease-4